MLTASTAESVKQQSGVCLSHYEEKTKHRENWCTARMGSIAGTTKSMATYVSAILSKGLHMFHTAIMHCTGVTSFGVPTKKIRRRQSKDLQQIYSCQKLFVGESCTSE